MRIPLLRGLAAWGCSIVLHRRAAFYRARATRRTHPAVCEERGWLALHTHGVSRRHPCLRSQSCATPSARLTAATLFRSRALSARPTWCLSAPHNTRRHQKYWRTITCAKQAARAMVCGCDCLTSPSHTLITRASAPRAPALLSIAARHYRDLKRGMTVTTASVRSDKPPHATRRETPATGAR